MNRSHDFRYQLGDCFVSCVELRLLGLLMMCMNFLIDLSPFDDLSSLHYGAYAACSEMSPSKMSACIKIPDVDELCSSYDYVQIFMVFYYLWGCGKVFSEIIFVAHNSLSFVSPVDIFL
jgi:hypothetical protein